MEQPAFLGRNFVTNQIAERDSRPHQAAQTERQKQPAFKPVALPALAAAVHAAGLRSRPSQQHALPAILRKEAMTD
jgi:hypothetical protein